MLLALLSIIDIMAGISILFPNFLGFYLGIIMLLKGGSSLLGSLTGSFTMAALGAVDIAAGLMLIFSVSLPLFWLVLLIKGVVSFVSSLS